MKSDPPVRILYVHNSADIYGASRSLARLLGRLDRGRFDVLVVLPEEGRLRVWLEELGVEVVRQPGLPVITRSLVRSPGLLAFPFRFLASAVTLRRLIRRRGVGLVHTNTGVIPSPALAARWAGVPHIWHIRDWFQEFRQFWGPYSRYICRNSARVLAVSEAMAAQFADRRRVHVLHNGFDLAEFAVPRAEYARRFRQQWGLGDDLVVGTVGRIKLVRKGQEVFVQAAALLAARGHRVKWVIVGAPFPGNEDHVEELRRMIRAQGLEGQVVFTGELDDPRRAYPAFDVFVLPSVQPEPFGGVVMEAMAMGVPVIATRLGGSIDQVAEGVTGFLVAPGDAGALAERVECLWAGPEMRARMALAGPERIARWFSLTEKVASLEALYEECVRSRAQS